MTVSEGAIDRETDRALRRAVLLERRRLRSAHVVRVPDTTWLRVPARPRTGRRRPSRAR